MWLGPGMGPQKNILAAEKMVWPCCWLQPSGHKQKQKNTNMGILMGLSLTMCSTAGSHLENLPSMERQSPGNECRQCLQIVLRGQAETETSAHPAPADCSKGKKSGYSTLNITQYMWLEWKNNMLYAKSKKLETPMHKIYKRNIEQIPIPICDTCNHTM